MQRVVIDNLMYAGGLPGVRRPMPQHQRQTLHASVPGAPPPDSIAAVNSALAGIPVMLYSYVFLWNCAHSNFALQLCAFTWDSSKYVRTN